MTKKIFRSIAFACIVTLLLCLLLIMGVLYNYFGNVQKDQLKTELALAVEGVETSGIAYLEGMENNECRLTYISEEGFVLYDSQSKVEHMENHANRKEVQQAIKTGTGESSRYSATLTEETLYYARRLSDGTILRASVSRRTVLTLFLGMIQPVFMVLSIVLILSLVIASQMSKRILEPLNQLNLEHPLDNNVYDELSPLLTRIEQQHRQIRNQKKELNNRKNEFYAVIKNMSEGLVLLNHEGVILSINPAAIIFFQTDIHCIGQHFLSVERDWEISKVLNEAEKNGHSEWIVSRNGLEYQINASRIDTDSQNSGIVILVFDITEKVFAEKNRREFTANVSHELKTPLHSIMGSAELMANGLVKEEDIPRFVGHIHSEAARLVVLIEDIIRLSQLDEKRELPLEDIDLHEVAESEVQSLISIAESKNITMSVEGASVMIKGVRQLVQEIIYNLCDNAIKYNVENGHVMVTVGQKGNGAVLSVTDTGIGIPEQHQSRVFERFYRVDKSHSKESGGTGLGLSIVKHAVEYMNGTIHLDSKVGKGTVITIEFEKKMERTVS